jgi:hypothetical protein
MLKAWSPAYGIIGRWWDLQEVGPSGKKLGHWGMLLKGAYACVCVCVCIDILFRHNVLLYSPGWA